MNKRTLILIIIDELSKKLAIMTQAANIAREEATHEDAKAENKYDTRGLEASYLAGAQAERAGLLEEAISYFENFISKASETKTLISAGALVELESEDKSAWYFLSPHEGGLKVRSEGKDVFVLGTQSPLGATLLGKSEGDEVEIKTPAGVKEYAVCSVV